MWPILAHATRVKSLVMQKQIQKWDNLMYIPCPLREHQPLFYFYFFGLLGKSLDYFNKKILFTTDLSLTAIHHGHIMITINILHSWILSLESIVYTGIHSSVAALITSMDLCDAAYKTETLIS